jgi:MOSC domain-containing protein YiiM
VEGMPDDEIGVGDVFRVGNTLLEVTQPRVPCFKLAMKMEMPEFLKLFMPSERVGFYFRVLEEGEVGTGDSIERVKADPEGITVKEMFHLLYYEKDKVDGARRALCIAAMSPGWRGSFEAIVSAAPEGASPGVDCGSGR